MGLALLCTVAFVPAFAVRPLDAGSGAQSLLQQDSEQQVKGVGDHLTSARASSILSTQLTSDLAIVEQHNLEIQEELEQTTREVGVLNKQLEEDKLMEKSLTHQIDAIRQGRKATVKHLSGALSAAGESAKKVVQDGWKTVSQIQVAALEGDDVAVASASSDRPGKQQTPGETSSLLQAGAFAAGGGYGVYGDDFIGEDQIWNPLREKSQHMEQTLDLLVAQRMKVDAAVNHEKLTLKKLNEDLKMLEVMKAASQAQEQKLRKGRAESLLKMYSAMYEGADAAKQAMSLGASRTAPEEVERLPDIEDIQTEIANDTEENTTTTTTVRSIVEVDDTGEDTDNVTMLELADEESEDAMVDLQPQQSEGKGSHRKSSKHQDRVRERNTWQQHRIEHQAAQRGSDVGESHHRAEHPHQRLQHQSEVLLDTKVVERSHKTHGKEKASRQRQHNPKPQSHGRQRM